MDILHLYLSVLLSCSSKIRGVATSLESTVFSSCCAGEVINTSIALAIRDPHYRCFLLFGVGFIGAADLLAKAAVLGRGLEIVVQCMHCKLVVRDIFLVLGFPPTKFGGCH